MTRTDQEIINIAKEHNVGDLNLGYTLRTRDRANDLVNRESIPSNVLPMRLINRNHPECNYSFAWCATDDSAYSKKFVADLKAEGYLPVVEGEWIMNEESWGWEKRTFRWGVFKTLMNPYEEFLMYRDEERWAAQQEKRATWNDDSIRARQNESLEQAARIAHNSGVGVEIAATAGGKENVVKPSTRRTVS